MRHLPREHEQERREGAQGVKRRRARLLGLHPVQQFVCGLHCSPRGRVDHQHAGVEVAGVPQFIEFLGQGAVSPETVGEVALQLVLAELGGADDGSFQIGCIQVLHSPQHQCICVEVYEFLDTFRNHVRQVNPDVVERVFKVLPAVFHTPNGTGHECPVDNIAPIVNVRKESQEKVQPVVFEVTDVKDNPGWACGVPEDGVHQRDGSLLELSVNGKRYVHHTLLTDGVIRSRQRLPLRLWGLVQILRAFAAVAAEL
mmetsp:Transcript_3665/g.6706  ORF Transcript_3665/g.6706 Transcript_3665/m.6706 type:complete len:256 (+) Transcript_3665:793-1560(+)